MKSFSNREFEADRIAKTIDKNCSDIYEEVITLIDASILLYNPNMSELQKDNLRYSLSKVFDKNEDNIRLCKQLMISRQ